MVVKLAHKQIQRDQDGLDELELAELEQEEYFNDGLSKYVLEALHTADKHREQHSIGERIAASLRMYRGEYTTDEKAKFDGIDVYRNIVGMLCRTGQSWVDDSYAMADDRPWTLSPTPRPELPRVMRDALESAVQQRFQQLAANGEINTMTLAERQDVVRALRELADRMAFDEASKAIKGMERLIEDQLTEGGWRQEFAKFRHSLMVFPTAIMRSPVTRYKRVAKWDGDKVVDKRVEVMCTENVDPIDVFPSPDSSDCQDGEYLVVRGRYTRTALSDCAKIKGFSKKAINLVLHANKEGVDDKTLSVNYSDYLTAVDSDSPNLYVVYEFNGRVPGSDILSWMHAESEGEEATRKGSEVDIKEDVIGKVDPSETYEIVAWLCGGKVIYVAHNDNILGERPYWATSYSKVPGSFWGRGIPDLACSLQAELNTAARSRAFNMAAAAGPAVEINVNMFSDEEEVPNTFTPWRVFKAEPGIVGSGAPAMRFYQPQSNAQEITMVMEEVWAKAHDLVGLPPYTRGSNQGAAQTLGAFSMQYNAASKGIKTVIGNIDIDVVEPVVRSYYMFNMLHGDDPTIKADAAVVARGAVGLVRKEQADSRPLETLQAIGPMVQNNPAVTQRLVADFLTGRGYDPAELGLTPGVLAQNMLPGAMGPSGPAVDGRSKGAEEAMAGNVIPNGM